MPMPSISCDPPPRPWNSSTSIYSVLCVFCDPKGPSGLAHPQSHTLLVSRDPMSPLISCVPLKSRTILISSNSPISSGSPVSPLKSRTILVSRDPMVPGPAWPRTAHSLLARLPVRGRAALARLAVHAPHLSGARGHRCPRPDPRGHVRAGAPAAGGFSPRCPPRAVPGSAPPPPRAPAALKVATAGARVGPPRARAGSAHAQSPRGRHCPPIGCAPISTDFNTSPPKIFKPGTRSSSCYLCNWEAEAGGWPRAPSIPRLRSKTPSCTDLGVGVGCCGYLRFDSGTALGSWAHRICAHDILLPGHSLRANTALRAVRGPTLLREFHIGQACLKHIKQITLKF